METKLRVCLADGGRGLLGERNPNPLAYHLGQLPKAAVLLLEQGQNLVSRQRAVELACLGINGETAVCLVGGLRLRRGGLLLNCADLARSPFGIFL